MSFKNMGASYTKVRLIRRQIRYISKAYVSLPVKYIIIGATYYCCIFPVLVEYQYLSGWRVICLSLSGRMVSFSVFDNANFVLDLLTTDMWSGQAD